MKNNVILIFGVLTCLAAGAVVSCSRDGNNVKHDKTAEERLDPDLQEEDDFLPAEDGIVVVEVQDDENGISNHGQLYSYTGPFNAYFQRVSILDPRVSYTFYEKGDQSRIYHGDFKMKFRAESPTDSEKESYGYIKGHFKDGEYDGDWTFIYPYTMYDSNSRHLVSIPYTAKLTCGFSNGKFNGPLKIIVTNANGEIMGEASLNYKNGKRNGELNYYTKFDSGITAEFEEVHGQYLNDKRIGEWTYLHGGNKGFYKYDNNGNEIEDYMIEASTGERTRGWEPQMYDLNFGTVSLAELQNVIADIYPNDNVMGLWNE